MAKYFAEIKDGVVQRVIVSDSKEWCEDVLGGKWIETFMDDPIKPYAGKGYSYDNDKKAFIPPKPYASWTLDEKYEWQPPKPSPETLTDKPVFWDEATNDWKEEE